MKRGMRIEAIEDSHQSLPDIVTAISDATLRIPNTIKAIQIQGAEVQLVRSWKATRMRA